MIVRLFDPACAAALFDGWPEAIVWSCVQGVMGSILADDPERPTAAMARLGDFRFFAGRPDEELVRIPSGGFCILVPRDEAWSACIRRVWGARARPITRYAIRKDTVFDPVHLHAAAASLPAGYALREIDEGLFDACRAAAWSRDLVSQFPDYAAYRRIGLGVAALKGERVVAGASTYARYTGGIEIEIDTAESERRQGLACACGAQLILNCLARGLYPSWDAHNPASVALAEKLGYRLDHPYPAFEFGWE